MVLPAALAPWSCRASSVVLAQDPTTDPRPGQDPRPGAPQAQAPGDVQGPPPPPRVELPQGPPPPRQPVQGEVQYDERVRQLEGRIVRSIRFELVDAQGRTTPMAEDAADSVVRSLGTRTGQPLELRKITLDTSNLWSERRLATRALVQEDGDQVIVTFRVDQEVQVYERVEFRGLRQFSRTEVEELLGLYADRQVTSTEAVALRNVLVARYRRDGFAFCSVDLREQEPEGGAPGDRPRRVLTFHVDEGPKVKVRAIQFRGNTTYPALPVLGLLGAGDYLLRDAHLQSDPAWGFSGGAPYSREILEEDLDRLRLFYRSRGFLDATVDLGDVRFAPDCTSVDLDILVVEGIRYRITDVKLVHVDDTGKPADPGGVLYPVEEVAKVLKLQPGEYYDHDKIRRDWQAIQDFYGRRGHPARSFPGMQQIPGAMRVGWPPRERYSGVGEVQLSFEIVEGTPKVLRDVVIRGNQFTRDHVIRRRVRAMPGQRIDMADVNRSIRNLEMTRYFQDPVTMQGPRFEFLRVDDTERPDDLDLAIDVKDGQTGELRWGIGISTGQGAQASFTFNKRNFDLFKPPSSWNPFTAIGEIIDSSAFHGGGQQLDLLLAPGTEQSQFQVTYQHPDLFGQHFDTWELRTSGLRLIQRRREGYTIDTLGANVGISRNLSDEFGLGVSFRQESVTVKDIAIDAPSNAWDAQGQTELRGPRLSARYRDYDDLRRPRSGVEITASAEMLGGFWGGEENMWKLTQTSAAYLPLLQNERGHKTVLFLNYFFGWANEFRNTDDVFLKERFFMGGANLRGFDFRGAGPSQFGRAYGGEAVFTASAEISFPLVATRLEREVRDRELLRGVVFTDIGFLGLGIDDPTFRELRGASGFGIRIEVPVLEIPIAIDLGWPWRYEETDDRQVIYFSIAR